MILSDRTIRAEIDAGRIVIDPFDPDCVQPSSVDLHVDAEFRVFANNRYPYIDVKEEQPDLTELVEVKPDEPIILYPGMKIGQISFFQLTTVADVPYGSAGSKYQGQRGPTASRFFEDFRGS